MLINFCDSSFAIGESTKDKSIRYLKQIKERAVEKLYDSENVLIVELNKQFNFLGFEFVRFDTERNHLKLFSENDKEDIENKIVEYKIDYPEMSLRAIGRELGISHMKVKRILEKNGM